MKRIKIIVLSGVILVLSGLILYNITFTKTISMTLYGVECRVGEEGSVDTEMYIKGKYYSRLFKKDTFAGMISVKGYDYTFDETMRMDNITITNWAILGYYKTYPRLETETLGRIFTTNNFKEIMIIPSEMDSQDYNSTNWRFICFPANTKAEAVKIAEYFWEDIVWD